MAVVNPFKALRPVKEMAGVVSSQPFDSASKDLADAEMEHNPYSYLHVVKPHLHFKGEKKNPQKHFPLGLEYLSKFKEKGVLIKDEEPCYYIYRIIHGSKAYTSLIACASVDDYLNNNILKHENTLTEKQNELAEHIRFFNSLGNPVLLTYPDDAKIDEVINNYINNHIPEYNFISTDQKKHNLWVVSDNNDIETIRQRFTDISKLYIADGHHRSSGSATYTKFKRRETGNFNGKEPFNFFPVCLIPFSKLTIYEYHRLVKYPINDLHALLKKVEQSFDIIPSGNLPVQPLAKCEFGLYVKHKAFLLKPKQHILNVLNSTLEKLDVSIVEKYLLNDVFEITDSKTDNRLSFLDGGKGIGHLQELVDNGDFDIAITLYPTSVEEMVNVANEHLIMPPKSTWIEPKIRTGLIIYEHI
ncbi:MAG: DUF1015 domain-containing protein [Bacteroidia bacterium]